MENRLMRPAARLVTRCALAMAMLSLLLPCAAFAATPYELAWLHQFGTPSDDFLSDVAADGNGKVFIVGTGSGDYVAAFNGDGGERLWTTGVGGFASGVAADGAVVFVTGSLSAGEENRDSYLAKYDAATGNLLWMKQFGGRFDDFAQSVAADHAGNVFVAGITYSDLEEGKVNAGNEDIFLAKFDAATGDRIWIRQFGSASYDGARKVVTDATGNAFVAGYTWGALEEGKQNAGQSDPFIAKLSGSTGDILWVRQFGSPASDDAYGLSVDANGVFATGPALALSGEMDCWLARFSSTGEQLWVKTFGTAGNDFAIGLAADGKGNVFVAGNTYGALGQGQSNAGGSDFFLGDFSASTGELLWVKQLGTPADETATGLTLDVRGSLFAIGWTSGALEAGKTNAGGMDVFLAKFNAPPTSAAEQITKIVKDFEAGVTAGSITGSGNGGSADGRLKAFRNKLLAAKLLVLEGDTAKACGQLKELYQKMDGASPPPDFVEGVGVAAIAAEIIDLRVTLGCQ